MNPVSGKQTRGRRTISNSLQQHVTLFRKPFFDHMTFCCFPNTNFWDIGECSSCSVKLCIDHSESSIWCFRDCSCHFLCIWFNKQVLPCSVRQDPHSQAVQCSWRCSWRIKPRQHITHVSCAVNSQCTVEQPHVTMRTERCWPEPNSAVHVCALHNWVWIAVTCMHWQLTSIW